MNKPSRRAAVRTGVWAVPVVATAAAAPAFAGTGDPPPVTIDGVGQACKLPGQSTDVHYGYRMVLTFHNVSGSAQVVTIAKFESSGAKTTDITPTQFSVPKGDSTRVFIVQSSNSAQRNATVTYVVDGQTVSTVVAFDSFGPCKCEPKDADPTDPDCNCS
jgi:hypothetical protein